MGRVSACAPRRPARWGAFRYAGLAAHAPLTGAGSGRRARGFTLAELLFGLAIAALLAAMALPSFAAFRRAADLSTATHQLLWALHFARSSAILNGAPVTLCLTADDRTCLSSPASAARGWLVVRRAPGVMDLAPEPDEQGQHLLHQFRLPTQLTVHGSRPAVTFWPVSRAGTTSTFDLCEISAQPRGRAVVVSQTGRPRVAQEEAACGA